MAAPLSEMLAFLWRPPRKEPGGFTIYRTCYGEDSDKHWNTLLDALRQQTRLAVGYYDDPEVMEEDKYWKQGPYKKEGRYISQLNLFKDLFRLFPREDPSLLDGLDIGGIREVCLKDHAETEEKMEGARFCFVLVADEAVLKGISQNQFFIKAVGYDWTETEGGWGWDRLRTGDLLDLWEMLLVSHEEGRSKYYSMGYDEPEEYLEWNIWLGDFGLPFFGKFSQIVTEGPKPPHSSVDS